MPEDPPATLRVLAVPGTTPGRWLRTWTERTDVPVELVHAAAADGLDVLRAGDADVGLVRLAARPEDLSAIVLYEEVTVVVVPKDHVVTAADAVTAADLVDETLLLPADDVLGWQGAPGERSLLPTPATTEDALALVASGAGVVLVPQSLARLHHRRDLTYRPVLDAPTSTVRLAWVTARTTDAVETFVGIVRGRTANSSRGTAATTDAEPDAGGRRRRGGTQPTTGRQGRQAGRAGGRGTGRGGPGGGSTPRRTRRPR